MLFQFPPIIEAGIALGKYAPVYSSAGIPLGIARDAVTGRFAAHAVGVMANSSIPINPLVIPLQGIQMYQTYRGFQAVQGGLQAIKTSIGVLQATTAVIGVGVAAGVALSAVNLYQTLKLKKAVEELKLTVENGFLDLNRALKEQGKEIIAAIQEVAQDIKFEQHRLILVKAYGLFTKAIERLYLAIQIQDVNRRNSEIDATRGMLFEALADYTNPLLLEEISAPALLRRQECSWAIEQTIIVTYQMQSELSAVSDRLSFLQNKIRTNCVTVIENSNSQDELEFIYPEISRIYDHDLMILESWQNQTDWIRSLPSQELKLLQSSDFDNYNYNPNDINTKLESITVNSEPAELILYQDLIEKYNPLSLHHQLLFMMDSNLRRDAELYISERAKIAGHQSLNQANLPIASNLAIANLFLYFQLRDDAE
jgi:hypothetical protein